MLVRVLSATSLAFTALIVSAPAQAQGGGDADALMAMSEDALEGEIGTRFNDALAASNNATLINADDPRYTWALEAKAQCGIALGYLESSTKDPVSIGRCELAHRLMQVVPPPPKMAVAPPPTVAPPALCNNPVAGIIFFDFDSDSVPGDAGETFSSVVKNREVCGWSGFELIGHADRSGAVSYNFGLSERRAENVMQILVDAGIPASQLSTLAQGESNPKVPTADGVRELQNRRVEITVR